jgi:hypothetical protein
MTEPITTVVNHLARSGIMLVWLVNMFYREPNLTRPNTRRGQSGYLELGTMPDLKRAATLQQAREGQHHPVQARLSWLGRVLAARADCLSPWKAVQRLPRASLQALPSQTWRFPVRSVPTRGPLVGGDH